MLKSEIPEVDQEQQPKPASSLYVVLNTSHICMLRTLCPASCGRVATLSVRARISNLFSTFLAYLGFLSSFHHLNHCRVRVSKVRSFGCSTAACASSTFLCSFSSFRIAIGSTPFANNCLAWAWRCRAAANDTSGYLPRAICFIFPEKRYRQRQSFPLRGHQ